MGLRVYNTMTRKKEDFIPVTNSLVKMYICGPTVYDYCHLGHGRAYVVFDVIYRYLKYKGFQVIYVRNITDIDDKIIARANEMAATVIEIAQQYTEGFLSDMEALNVQIPDHQPRATSYIDKMIEMIQGLIAKGYAYAAAGDVYYDVAKYADYGCLSGRDKDNLLAGARVQPDPKKRNPLDFVLWKESKPNEPWWPSPWGKGRPGWHIECSAMSLNILGDEFDIHGGGQDLIFPHHENEIAQSSVWSGRQPVRYWLHNGFVTINKEKMSKSLKNFFTLKDIFKKYSPAAVRLFFLTQHYRSPIDFSDQLLADAAGALTRIEDCLLRSEDYLRQPQQIDSKEIAELRSRFLDIMDDDFNAPQALAFVFDLVRRVNSGLGRENSNIAVPVSAIKEFLQVLGLDYKLAATIKVAKEEMAAIAGETLDNLLAVKKLARDQVAILMKYRLYCRTDNNWPVADKIRNHLAGQGYLLRDTAKGTECLCQD